MLSTSRTKGANLSANTVRNSGAGAFTLLETLVATTIFTIVMIVGISMFGQVSSVWSRSMEQVKAFQAGRISFDLLTRNLSQASLNTYLDYMDSSNRFPADADYDNRPVRYARRSDLQFVCALAGQDGTPGTPNTGTAVFFQMPGGFEGTSSDYTGLDDLLNPVGYYIKFSDNTTRPTHTPNIPRYRYRLMQMMVPTQENEVFTAPDGNLTKWYTDYADVNAYPVADNVIALIMVPMDPENPISDTYAYNSRLNERTNPQPITANQMPPAVRVTMVTIDENSALRMESGASEPALIADALSGKFESLNQFEDDLQNLEDALTAARVNYQVFSSSVPIRESKWSKN